MQVNLTNNLMALELPEHAYEISINQDTIYYNNDIISFLIQGEFNWVAMSFKNGELLGVIQGGVIPDNVARELCHNSDITFNRSINALKREASKVLISKGLDLNKTNAIIKTK